VYVAVVLAALLIAVLLFTTLVSKCVSDHQVNQRGYCNASFSSKPEHAFGGATSVALSPRNWDFNNDVV
jgi:hypothetical protein